MTEIPYSLSYLRKCINFSDLEKIGKLNDYQEKTKIAQSTLIKIHSGNIFADTITKKTINNKEGYTFNSVEAAATARLIARNIKANYPLKQSNRHALITNSTALLKESTPYNIYRYDIKSFFESIDRKLLLEKLISDGACSWQTLLLIDGLFKLFDSLEIDGLPRGLTLSSTLSELTLLDFDASIKSIEGVFFYGRFVDDILIITSNTLLRSEFDKIIESHLPPGLEFHATGKRDYLPIRKITTNDQDPKTHTFDYLGYKIQVFNKHSDEKIHNSFRRQVLLEISDSKIEKIKKKTLQSFAAFISSPKAPSDLTMLEYRIKALTGNYHISDSSTGIKIKTGIYYNYPHKNTHIDCKLTELDNFMRSLLFSNKTPISKRIKNSISLEKRKQLAGLSFLAGFKRIRFHSFNFILLRKIKRIWR